MFSPVGGPTLEEPDLVPRIDSADISRSVDETTEERPSLADTRQAVTSPARAVEPS